jgi:class 3 adenylate cyclase
MKSTYASRCDRLAGAIPYWSSLSAHRDVNTVMTNPYFKKPLAQKPVVKAIVQRPQAIAREERVISLRGSRTPLTAADSMTRRLAGVAIARVAPVLRRETTYATVLFADMRGYMAIAEQLPPGQVVALLEEFFGVLSVATQTHGGKIFHMAGDGMMAGFGVREPDKHGAREALAAARAMLECFSAVAIRWQREFSIVAGIGVGLHLGEVALAMFGPPGHRTSTLVGDTANVAARLCGRARSGEVLFSSSVADALGVDGPDLGSMNERPSFLLLPQLALRGRSGLLDIWCAPTSIDGFIRAGHQPS